MSPAIRLAALVALLPAGAASAATLIHAGRLVDGVSPAPRERVTIVVEGERIQGIEGGFRAAGSGDQVVDLTQSTVLPGFMDMHVHLTSEQGRTSELDSIKKGEADRAYDSTVFAERTLLAGFTTVRNLGDHWNISIALRRAIEAGKVKGPRVYTAGRSIGTRGGHADATNAFGPYFSSGDPRLDTVCNGADSCREAVRQRYQDGADSIKITATGGVLSIAKSGSAPQFTDDELAAIMSTAHDYGMKVAAHAHGSEGIKRAVRNGVDSIEHGTFMDDEAIRLMKENGTHYVPTISAGRFVYQQAQDPDLLSGDRAPQGAGRRAADPGDVRQGLAGGRHDHVRHRHRRQRARRQCQGIRVHGRVGHAGHGCDPLGHDRAGKVSRDRRPARQPRGRQDRGHRRRARRPARRRPRPRARVVRHEGWRHLQALSEEPRRIPRAQGVA